MSSRRVPDHRRSLSAIALSCAAALLTLAPAAGADATTNCAGLQAALNASAAGRDVITLTEMCTVANSGASNGAFTLPSQTITLQGQPGTGAGFDGTGVATRMLGWDQRRRDQDRKPDLPGRRGPRLLKPGGGTATSQGLSSPTLDSVQFYNNIATTGASGGGASLATTNGTITVTNSTFGEVGGEAIWRTRDLGSGGRSLYNFDCRDGLDHEFALRWQLRQQRLRRPGPDERDARSHHLERQFVPGATQP